MVMYKVIKSLLKGSWISLYVGLLVVSGTVKAKQLHQVQATQNSKYGIDKRSLVEIQEQKTPDRFTQTTAHLQTKEVMKLLKKEPSSKFIPYLDMIFDCLVKEQDLKDSHYVFYHTTPNQWRLASDVYSQAYAWKYPNQKIEDFLFLRFSDFDQMSPRDFLLQELKQNGLVDNRGKLAALLLSVNLSLFGNMDWKTSSTWEYFLTELKKETPNRKVYEDMMDKFGLTHKYIDELLSLTQIYETKENTLLQIFVPQDKVDQIGYLAWSLGIPKHEKTISWVYDYLKKKSSPISHRGSAMEILAEQFKMEQEKNPLFKDLVESVKEGDFSLHAYLKIYRNTPWAIEGIDHDQARLIFTPNGLLNPAADIQFYRYSTASKEQLREYTERLNGVMKKIFAESKKGGK